MIFKFIIFNVSWTPCQLKNEQVHFYIKKANKLTIHKTITHIYKKKFNFKSKMSKSHKSLVNPKLKLHWNHKYASFPFHHRLSPCKSILPYLILLLHFPRYLLPIYLRLTIIDVFWIMSAVLNGGYQGLYQLDIL